MLFTFKQIPEWYSGKFFSYVDKLGSSGSWQKPRRDTVEHGHCQRHGGTQVATFLGHWSSLFRPLTQDSRCSLEVWLYLHLFHSRKSIRIWERVRHCWDNCGHSRKVTHWLQISGATPSNWCRLCGVLRHQRSELLARVHWCLSMQSSVLVYWHSLEAEYFFPGV